MRILFFLALIVLFACTRERHQVDSFIAPLDFVYTNSPASVQSGSPITSNVRCTFPYSNGVSFNSFSISEVAPQHYRISATVRCQNVEITQPALWQMDSSVTIQTLLPGPHILDFYNFNGLFKSDTVIVN